MTAAGLLPCDLCRGAAAPPLEPQCEGPAPAQRACSLPPLTLCPCRLLCSMQEERAAWEAAMWEKRHQANLIEVANVFFRCGAGWGSHSPATRQCARAATALLAWRPIWQCVSPPHRNAHTHLTTATIAAHTDSLCDCTAKRRCSRTTAAASRSIRPVGA